MNLIVLKGIKECLTLSGVKAKLGKKPKDEDLNVLTDAAIVFDSHIRWLGKESSIPKEYQSVVSVNLKGKIVTPGLIDSHTHIVFGGERSNEYAMRAAGASYQEISESGGGILSTVTATRDTSTEELYYLARKRCEESMRRGITTIEIKSGYGLTSNDEIRLLKIIQKIDDTLPISIVPTFLGAHAIPPEYRSKREAYVNLLCENLIPEVSKLGLAQFCDIFIEQGYFTPSEGRQILSCAKKNGLKLKIHAEQLTHFGGGAVAAALGATSADHLEYLSDNDLKSLIDTGVVGVLLPGASFFLGTDYPPARRFIDQGLPVAIATDWNPGTCMSGDLLMMMTIAMSQMKMTIAEAFSAVTFNAARALGLDDRGVIEVGQRADLAVFDTPSFKHLPYHFAKNHLSTLYIEGRQVV